MQRLGKTSGREDPGPAWTLSPSFLFLGEWDVCGLVLWVSGQKSCSQPLCRVCLCRAHSGVALDFGEVLELDGTWAVPGASWEEVSREKVGLDDL